MGEGFRGPGGGLPAAARALLIPENIRAGVHIKGGGVDVVGSLTWQDLLPDRLDLYDSGVEHATIAVGTNGIGQATTAQKQSTCILLRVQDRNGTAGEAWATVTTPIDVKKYQKAYFRVYTSLSNTITCGISLGTGTALTKSVKHSGAGEAIVFVDISDIDGLVYFRCINSFAGYATCTGYVYQIYLET